MLDQNGWQAAELFLLHTNLINMPTALYLGVRRRFATRKPTGVADDPHDAMSDATK